MAEEGLRVALLSLEPWDDVWRRNQYFAANLVKSGAVSQLMFLEPATFGPRSRVPREVMRGIRAVPLQLRLPKRAGGLAELGRRLRAGPLRGADVLWVNDPALGVHCLRDGQPALYDVTDDWRTYDFPARIVRRIVAAEDVLARRARTVVCSVELQKRWSMRYGFESPVVNNGVDIDAWRAAEPRAYDGQGPHVGYVGTLQSERLDIELVLRVADAAAVGTVHLIGPNALDETSAERLRSHPKVAVHGPVPAHNVPSWTKGLDVLVCPHVVTPFTLSLDAIKSYEYLASGRPIVATPTSGFQRLAPAPGVHAVPANSFVATLTRIVGQHLDLPSPELYDWKRRAADFALQLHVARKPSLRGIPS